MLSEGTMTVPVEMWTGAVAHRTLHARAEVVLVDSREPAPRDLSLPLPTQPIASFKSAYLDGRLFHGPWFQAIEEVVHCDANSIHALTTSAPNPKQWIENPCRPNWILDPLGLDAAFQLMILWSWEHRTAACLPCGVRSFRQFRSAFPTTGLRVVVDDISADSNLTTANIRFLDRSGNLVAMVEGFESVIDPGLKKAFQQNRLQHEEQV